jgi:hypothetical protein
MQMLFAAAMQAVANGKTVRRVAWVETGFHVRLAGGDLVTITDGRAQLSTPAMFCVPGMNPMPYYADPEDQAANDWESDPRYGVSTRYLQPDGELPPDPAGTDTNGSPVVDTPVVAASPGTEAPQPNASPENESGGAAPAVSADSGAEQGVGLPASADASAAEAAPVVQKVMQDSGTPAAAGGVQADEKPQ